MASTHLLTLDLRDDPALIDAYERHHRAVPAAVERAIRASGITAMTLHRLGTRLVMTLAVEDGFSFARKAAMDTADPDVRRWEALMERFQDVAPGDAPRKWREMTQIYRLTD